MIASAVLLALPFLQPAVALPGGYSNPQPQACASLTSSFTTLTHLPGSEPYNNSTRSYFNVQNVLTPSCVFTPTSAADLSTAIRTLVSSRTKFAVKSGGHMTALQASAIGDGGVLISFEKMKGTEWKDGGDQVLSVGPGLVWSEVYEKAQERGRIVVGGRQGGVGVGGLLLGSGLSFVSSKYGLACDNVVGYEAVLANGKVVYATSTGEYKDLFRAFCGGASNFGIVTRFDLQAHPLTLGYGAAGMVPLLNPNLTEAAIAAVSDYNMVGSSDENAGMHSSFVSLPSQNLKFLFAGIFHQAPPPDGSSVPESFRVLRSLPGQWGDGRMPLGAAVAIGSTEGSQKGVMRNRFRFFAMRAVHDAPAAFWPIVEKRVNEVKDVPGVLGMFNTQQIPKVLLHNASGKSNVMGLERFLNIKEPGLLWVITQMSWLDGKDDERMVQQQNKMVDEMKAWAKKKGVLEDLVYLNDASEGQEVFKGYGEKSYRFLKDVKRKYDKDNVWGKLMPGGFKL